VITKAQADRFGKDWIEAWNSHDLDSILSHYSEDFVMPSPHIAVIAGEPSGVLNGEGLLEAGPVALPRPAFRTAGGFVGRAAAHYLP
jgi:hypothetical protein